MKLKKCDFIGISGHSYSSFEIVTNFGLKVVLTSIGASIQNIAMLNKEFFEWVYLTSFSAPAPSGS